MHHVTSNSGSLTRCFIPCCSQPHELDIESRHAVRLLWLVARGSHQRASGGTHTVCDQVSALMHASLSILWLIQAQTKPGMFAGTYIASCAAALCSRSAQSPTHASRQISGLSFPGKVCGENIYMTVPWFKPDNAQRHVTWCQAVLHKAEGVMCMVKKCHVLYQPQDCWVELNYWSTIASLPQQLVE